MSDDTKIIELKIPFKEPVSDDLLLVVKPQKCFHGPYEVDSTLALVTCKKCGDKLNPMDVLVKLAYEETKWHRSRTVYTDEMARLSERTRTKCQHCHKLTRISRS